MFNPDMFKYFKKYFKTHPDVYILSRTPGVFIG
jgi:hypothetical protein